MLHFQLFSALLLVSTAMGCAPSCAPSSRIVRVPATCPNCPVVEPPKCPALQQWPAAECEVPFGTDMCREVPGTLDSVLDCGTDKLVYNTVSAADGIYTSGKCYSDGTTPSSTFVYTLPSGEMAIPTDKAAKVACVKGI